LSLPWKIKATILRNWDDGNFHIIDVIFSFLFVKFLLYFIHLPTRFFSISLISICICYYYIIFFLFLFHKYLFLLTFLIIIRYFIDRKINNTKVLLIIIIIILICFNLRDTLHFNEFNNKLYVFKTLPRKTKSNIYEISMHRYLKKHVAQSLVWCLLMI